MKSKEDFKRSIELHIGDSTEKLANYHAVCIELERARSLYGQEFSDSLVRDCGLVRFGIKEIAPTNNKEVA